MTSLRRELVPGPSNKQHGSDSFAQRQRLTRQCNPQVFAVVTSLSAAQQELEGDSLVVTTAHVIYPYFITTCYLLSIISNFSSIGILLYSNLWNMEHLGIPRLLNHGLIFHSCLTLCSLWNMEHFPWEPFSTFSFHFSDPQFGASRRNDVKLI